VLNSSYDYREKNFFFDALNIPIIPRQKLLVLEHNLPNIKKYRHKEQINVNNIAVLNKSSDADEKLTVISPHYFGRVSNLQKRSCEKTIFITVGSNYRSYAILLQSIKRLIEMGINDFETVLVGKPIEQIILEKKYARYLRKLGVIDFEKMYAEVERAHFMLFLLEKSNSRQSDYLYNKTSGMRLLSLGFLKPAIIQYDFGEAYGFNERNSIIYQQDDELAEAMLRAAKMNSEVYEKMQKNLFEMAEKIKLDSIEGIKRILKLINTKEAL
jgi:hypothetical protein